MSATVQIGIGIMLLLLLVVVGISQVRDEVEKLRKVLEKKL